METAIAAWEQHLLRSSKLAASTITEYIQDVTRFATWLRNQERMAPISDLTVGDAKDYRACRRGLVLRFRSGPGPLTFHVAAAPAISAPPPREIVAATPLAAPRADSRPPRPPRPPRRRQTATERYHNVLPRWMRAGQQGSRPNGTAKRRPR